MRTDEYIYTCSSMKALVIEPTAWSLSSTEFIVWRCAEWRPGNPRASRGGLHQPMLSSPSDGRVLLPHILAARVGHITDVGCAGVVEVCCVHFRRTWRTPPAGTGFFREQERIKVRLINNVAYTWVLLTNKFVMVMMSNFFFSFFSD
jgi:hypothetical protein